MVTKRHDRTSRCEGLKLFEKYDAFSDYLQLKPGLY
jgi:hypothetical protein